MFLKAIIDETTELSPKQERFASILEFVADDFDSGIFYVFKDWAVKLGTGQSTSDFHPNQPRLVYFSKKEIAAMANGQPTKATFQYMHRRMSWSIRLPT
jgi:hypothetical protein